MPLPYNVEVVPPLGGATTVVNGRTYTCQQGETLSVPENDYWALLANGWTPLPSYGGGSTPRANEEQPYLIGQSGIPVILPQTTGGNIISAGGVLTQANAYPYSAGQPCWVYLPANTAGAGAATGAAGLYYGVFLTTTTIQIYTNYQSPAAAFIPFIPAAPLVNAVGSAAAVATLAAADQTLLYVSLTPGGEIGANGCLRGTLHWSTINNANVKSGKVKLSGTQIHSATLTSGLTYAEEFTMRNRGVQNSQIITQNNLSDSGAVAATAFTYTAVDTSSASSPYLAVTAQVATATDFAVLEAFSLELLPSP